MPRFCLPPLALLIVAAVPPAPPAAPGASNGPPAARLATFRAGPVRCGAFEEVPIRAAPPLPVAAAIAGPVEDIRFAFRIDQEGRPLGVRRIGTGGGPALDARDLAPALTAWRFEPGNERPACEVAFSVTLQTIESADEDLLYRYAALGRLQLPDGGGGALLREAFARLRPQGSTCAVDPVPRRPINLRFQSIPEAPGAMSYNFFSYDVDAEGRPVHIRLLRPSDNPLLDMAGDSAIGQAQFPAQPRIGCLYYFYRYNNGRLPAPPLPADLQLTSDTCDPGISSRVAGQFQIRYPIEFTRRPAEAWVVFSYDIDGSGKLDNLRILASEPAARFGEEVARAAAEIRLKGIAGMQRNCIQRVRFALPGR